LKPQDKLKQLMAKLVELPPTDNKLDLAIDFCSNGEFPTAQSVSDAIVADIQSASSPKAFLWDSCNIDLENDDVGSIVGFDASGGPVLDKYDIVPEGDVSELVVPPSTEVINGLTVTYPPYNSLNPSGQFIMKCMSKWWLKGAFDLVEQAYGLKFDENSFVTTMPIQLDNIPSSGGAIIMAYVRSYYDTTTFKTNKMECAVNTNPAAYGDMDLTNPNGKANSYAGSNMFLDRTLCHELVHGVMSANISGFNAKLPKYFIEGTAELIAGADDTRKDGLLATAGSVSMFQAGLDNNATDTLRWYTTGYIWLRWYIKHTSKKGIDLSFEHPLPDFEIFEYKVSDGVAFEYGRANNKRFDLIGDELVDFYTRYHVGLNEWDLCTSPEYLNSKYGSTIRIPFDDAVERNDIDYIDIGYKHDFDECVMTSRKGPRKENGVFVYTYPDIVSTFAFGPPMPHGSSEHYLEAYGLYSSLKNGSDIHGFIYSMSTYMHEWNTSLGISDYDDVSDMEAFSKAYPFKTRHYILIGAEHLYNYFNPWDSPNIVDVLSNIDSDYEDAVEYDFYVKFYDFSFLRLCDVVDNIITNEAYVQSLTGDLSSNDLTIVQYIESKGYGDRIQYYDCRKYILESFPSVDDFRNMAICTELPDNIFWGKYPISSSDFCLTEYFADVIWERIQLGAYFHNAEYKEITYTLPPDYVIQPSYDTNYEALMESILKKGIEDGIYFAVRGFTGILCLFGFIANDSIYKETKYGGPKFWADPRFDNNYYPLDFGFNHASVFSRPITYPLLTKKGILDELETSFYTFYAGGTGGGGQVIVYGFEFLCIYGFTVAEIVSLIDKWTSDILAFENNVFNVAFIPMIVYSKTLYNFYLDLKASCIKHNIPIALDNYVCMYDDSVSSYKEFSKLIYKDFDESSYISQAYMPSVKMLVDELNLSTDDDWVYIDAGLNYFFFESSLHRHITLSHHTSNTKSPCYYASFTQLPFSDRFDKIRTVEGGTQAYDGVSADILDVNLHTVYDPLSPSYYQGGGTCKEVYDFVIDPITNKSMLGLINYHKEDDNSPNVDNNYSYPIYGSGCPWIVYSEKEKLSYDSVYFYFTRDAYSGTITYQLTSNRYPSLKPIFQTIVFGSPDTDNYTSKYPLYVGGGANYITHTEYSYTYMPPGKDAKPVTVHVEGNKYSLNLTGTKTSNISPIYPSAEPDSGVTNFVFRGSDGEWKYLASFDGSISNDEVLFAHKLADPYYWGIIFPYVASDIDYSYIYEINTDNTNIYKPVRIINPYRELKEERGFGTISLSNLYAKCSDNRFGIRKVKTKEYIYNSILDKIENNIIYLIDDFDKFDKLDIIFTDGNNQYTTTWHKNSLNRAFKYSLDIDFDLTRGIVYNLSWNVDKSSSTKNTFYNLSNNCTIIDVVGYKNKYSRYLVLPNSCVRKEFGMEDATGGISTYSLNNVLCIYLGEG